MKELDSISIIIPVINEAKNLQRLVPFLTSLKNENLTEIIVVDGGSSDNSILIAQESGAKVISSKIRSRAIQLNQGAAMANGSILYFVHADSFPVKSLASDIISAKQSGFQAGCFSYKFDSLNPLLKINSWFTQFNGILSGGGDQTLFIEKSLFKDLQGFNVHYSIMEDFEFVQRIKKVTRFKIIQKPILVSARKYEKNSWLLVQWANFIALVGFQLGIQPARIKNLYYKLIK